MRHDYMMGVKFNTNMGYPFTQLLSNPT